MKRAFAILLVLTMLLSLVACGSQSTTAPSVESDGTTEGTESTTVNPYDAMAGKYLIYHMDAGTYEMNYFQISMSRFAGTYIELHADGTVSGFLFGSEMPEGNTWNAETMIFTNAEGETNTFTIEDNAMLFSMDGGSMTLLKEGDPRLDDLPTPFQYLHDYIVTNGTQNESGVTVICKDAEIGQTTMTVTSDGGILWKIVKRDGNFLKMVLSKEHSILTFTMLYKNGLMNHDYTCTATFDASLASMWDIEFISYAQDRDTGTWGLPDFYKSSVESLGLLMLTHIQSYLISDVGITMESLGFTSYNK